MKKISLLIFSSFFFFSFYSLATKESAEMRGGDHLGVIWSTKENQNIWRMPQQVNVMGSNIQITRTGTSIGTAEGGFFLKKETSKKVFGKARSYHFGLYINNSNPDFDRVNDNDTIGSHQNSLTQGRRVDFFIGGVSEKYNLGFRLGFNEIRAAAASATADKKKRVSVFDLAIGGTLGRFDVWAKYAADPRSDNGTYRENSHSSSYQVGIRTKLFGNMFYLEHNAGLENPLLGLALAKRSYSNRKKMSITWQFGFARVHKVKKQAEFFWNTDWTYVHLDKEILNYASEGYYLAKLKGWRFHWTFGFSQQFFSWLKTAGSFEYTAYDDFNKPFDAEKKMTKANLGVSLFSRSLQLDLNSSYTGLGVAGLNEIFSSTTGTLIYHF